MCNGKTFALIISLIDLAGQILGYEDREGQDIRIQRPKTKDTRATGYRIQDIWKVKKKIIKELQGS